MAPNEQLSARAVVEYTLGNDQRLLKSFVKNPKPVLERLGVDEDALVCTDEAHAAVERAEKVRAALQERKLGSATELLPRAGEAVEKAFGEDYVVEKIPFGIRFCESVKQSRTDISATGTIGINFRPRVYVDVDG